MNNVTFSLSKLLDPKNAPIADIFNKAVEGQWDDRNSLFFCGGRIPECRTYNGVMISVFFAEEYAYVYEDGYSEDAGIWDAGAEVQVVDGTPLLMIAGADGPSGGTESISVWFNADGQVVKAETQKPESMAKAMSSTFGELLVEPATPEVEAILRAVFGSVIE